MLPGVSAVLLQLLATASPQDAKLLREARTAQFRFESVRRMHLPREWRGGSGSRCDARIGRYCYSYDSTESAPRPEAREIVESRDKLIRFLDSAAARAPADGWIAGQRTRYLLEARRPEDAIAAGRACAAERWWCAALEGLALHVAERYKAADSLFSVAVEGMPERQRCEWLDLSKVAGERIARALARAPCEERAALADRLWTVSQPLWSTPGNDLRTEHFARLTMAAILDGTANAHGMAFGDDSRELVIRYGWAEWFTREDANQGMSTSPVITGHDREPSYFFYPELASPRLVSRLTAGSWNLRSPVAPSRYAPRHVKSMSDLPHMLVRFARGDSMEIAVAFDIRDSALAADSLSAYLGVLQRGELSLRVRGSGRSVLWMKIHNDTAIASIEVRGATSKRAARARYTIEPLASRAGTSLSDLLLYDATGDAPRAPRALMLLARTDATISTRTPLGVYWEIEGVPGGTPVTLSLTVEPTRTGIARRIAARLGLAPEVAPVRLSWQSAIRDSAEGQSVALRLPPRARGKYRVLLSVDRPGAPPLTTSREIELVR